jgi:hypothetical protein
MRILNRYTPRLDHALPPVFANVHTHFLRYSTILRIVHAVHVSLVIALSTTLTVARAHFVTVHAQNPIVGGV